MVTCGLYISVRQRLWGMSILITFILMMYEIQGGMPMNSVYIEVLFGKIIDLLLSLDIPSLGTRVE